MSWCGCLDKRVPKCNTSVGRMWKSSVLFVSAEAEGRLSTPWKNRKPALRVRRNVSAQGCSAAPSGRCKR